MDQAIKIAKFSLLVAGTALCIVAILAVNDARARFVALATDLDRVVLSVGGTAAELRKASKEWSAASKTQAAYWDSIAKQTNQTLVETDKTVRALTALAERTDHNINDLLLPQATASLAASTQDFQKVADATAESVKKVGESSEGALGEAARAARTASARLDDPNIGKSVAALASASQHVDEATGHLNASTALIEQKVRTMTAPASFGVRVGTFVLDLAAKFGSIAAGFFK